jgi:lycopene cyclase domain-containing protein
MSTPSHAYLFLELAALVYLVGFAGRHLRLRDFLDPILSRIVIGLVVLWFVLDEIALSLGLWTFPENGTLKVRVLGLPLEECLLLVLHPIVCYALIKRDIMDSEKTVNVAEK